MLQVCIGVEILIHDLVCVCLADCPATSLVFVYRHKTLENEYPNAYQLSWAIK